MSPLRRAILAYATCRIIAKNERFHVDSVSFGREVVWIASARLEGRKGLAVHLQRMDVLDAELMMLAFAGWLEFVMEMLVQEACVADSASNESAPERTFLAD